MQPPLRSFQNRHLAADFIQNLTIRPLFPIQFPAGLERIYQPSKSVHAYQDVRTPPENRSDEHGRPAWGRKNVARCCFKDVNGLACWSLRRRFRAGPRFRLCCWVGDRWLFGRQLKFARGFRCRNCWVAVGLAQEWAMMRT